MVMDSQIHSVAFQKAELQSERLRILGVLSFFAVFVLVMAVRIFVVQIGTRTAPRVWGGVLLVVFVVTFEYGILRKVNLALKQEMPLSSGFWVLSTILESTIPAWAVAFLPDRHIEPIYRPLASPAVLVFFIFIILSTLRLSSWICILSGAAASVSYLCAALYLGWRPPLPGTHASMAHSTVDLNAVTLLVSGIVAGAITAQIRKHVLAALREAETARKLGLVQRDLQVARSIQQSLLPQKPIQVQGFEIAGWNQPADDTGGDYFDWQSLPDGRVVITLADVTGHGIGPALLATMCRAYARASFRVSPNLPIALEHINRALGADMTTGRFATFVAAVCCPECADVEILSAGHGPLFIYSRLDDKFTDLNAHALPFGILPSFHAEPPTRTRLSTGDLVLLATDGFFEWENEQGEDFGVQRIKGVVRACRDAPPKEIVTKLYESAMNFARGSKQQDDLTAVIIKRM